MNAPQYLQPPTDALRRLADFLQASGDRTTLVQAATVAIDEWIAAQQGRFTNLAPTPSHGYQWKSVFLPEGSELRLYHDGEAYFARVLGDAIMYQGRRVSPRQMTIAVAGDGRNAWRDLWIRLPTDTRWRPAAMLRRELEQREAPPPVSPLDAMTAAAACMTETLKTAVALVEHAKANALPQLERRVTRVRRGSDRMEDDCAFD